QDLAASQHEVSHVDGMDAVQIFSARVHGACRLAQADVVVQDIYAAMIVQRLAETTRQVTFRGKVNLIGTCLATFLPDQADGFLSGPQVEVLHAHHGAQARVSNTGRPPDTHARG